MSEPVLPPRDGRLHGAQRLEVACLSLWFFVITLALWLLKPIRMAALLAHLGSEELPMLRLGSVLVVGVVVLGYSRVVNRLSRLQVTLGASLLFTLLILSVWCGLWLKGDALGSQRWFVWAVFCLVEAYATVMVTIFWTYTNDVVSRAQADRLYVRIGLGGILGGIAGGTITDSLIHSIGPVHMLLVCAGCVLLSAGLAWAAEALLSPPPRAVVARGERRVVAEELEGAARVLRSEYLLWMVGVVVAYESAAALTDYVVNVIFERSFRGELELAQMYGRLGWIVSVTALLCQLLIVPVLLPAKRVALLVPPLVMAVATLSLAILPVATLALVVAASDRGLNYSLQQVTRETLYVPLDDVERYKAKAFIDIFVDRAAKALGSLTLVIVMLFTGTSLLALLTLALGSLLLWARCAHGLGTSYTQLVEKQGELRHTAAQLEEAPAERGRP
jgi:ATP:ADP antiporter, AAA family